MVQRSLTELQSRAEEYALDRIPMGVVIVDEHLVATFINRSARAILAHKSGLQLTHGVLAEVSPENAGKLRRAKEERKGVVLSISRRHHRPLDVFICPLPEHVEAAQSAHKPPSAIIFLSDPDAGMYCDERMLREVYDLTSAEARTACALLEGQTLQESAKRLGVTVHTVRTHLKRVFEKTHTTRQADLIRILVGGLCRLRLQ
jgi:DNA-binding CsgD family transcriptional regulator